MAPSNTKNTNWAKIQLILVISIIWYLIRHLRVSFNAKLPGGEVFMHLQAGPTQFVLIEATRVSY